MRQTAYVLWQVVWGLPQTLAGACAFLACALARRPHFNHHGALVTIWKPRYGLSLGPFVFLNAWESPLEDANPDENVTPRFVEYVPGAFLDDRLLVHEYGHTVQSLILGPLYLLVVGLPSIVWLKTPRLSRRRRNTSSSYYAFYTERWANHLGEQALKRPSMGMALID